MIMIKNVVKNDFFLYIVKNKKIKKELNDYL